MAKKIGNLAVILSADQSRFDKAMRAATARVQAFPGTVGRAATLISGRFAALAGVAAAALSVRSLLNTASAIDAVAKASDRLQVPVDRLMGLQYGAKLAGIETAVFDQAFVTMIKNVELGAQGLGRARTAAEELGIDIKKLAGLDAENQFKVIAEALSRVEDKGHAASIAMRIFGDQGAALVPFFAQGAAGVNAMQQEAERLGLTLDAVDVNKVVIAQDQLERVREVLKSISNALVVELAPYVSAAADQFLEWSKTGKTWGEIIGGAVEWVAMGVAKLMDVVDLAKIAWQGLRAVGSAALYVMLKPLHLLIQGIVKLVDLGSKYLPQSLVDAADSSRAFADGFMEGIADVATDASQTIIDTLTGESASSKVERFFKDVKAKAEAAATDMATTAPPTVPFRPEMYDEVLGGVAEDLGEKVQESVADAIEQVSFGANDLIRAGSAEAQASGLRSYTSMLDRRLKEQIELERRQLREQEKIAKNTRPDPIEDLEPEVIFDG